ncbi:MAG: crotonase/enoyl-CoA hydratase family protein [Immundisolibacterales bacterium]|nr:crotonase/enoyl-CoA hydratase family protein [Immundisolibacterales bacterium]
MAQFPNVLIETRGLVRIVTINRPRVRNAVDPSTANDLREAFLAFADDDSVDVAVFTGAKGAFCAGYDLKALSAARGAISFDPEGVGPMGPSRLLLDKPVIAAVEGPAVAGGLELALWCDLRIAAEDAVFGVYCRRWGVPLIDGGTVRLPRLVGHSRAMDMILTGRPVRGPEALEFGLANRLVPKGTALEAAVALAEELTRFPQLCMRTDRMSAIRQWGMPLEEALRHEGRAGVAPLEREAVDGATRFAGGKGRAGAYDDT